MEVHYTSRSLQEALQAKRKNNNIGFVPTMGALHKGHLSLIKEAQLKNEIIVVSIFVNPTQFDNQEDLNKYPRTLADDVDLLKSIDCDFVFAPSVEEIYNKSILSEKYSFDGLENQMEGKHREGHFDGVGTIVKRLFEIVQPTYSYFGEKDFQQLQIIKKLVDKYQIPTKVIGCKIHREKDGLAMSSRNTRLTKEHRQAAPFIYKVLKEARLKFKTQSARKVNDWIANEFQKNELLELEYFEIANVITLKTISRKQKNNKYRAFIAAFAGNIRLIDNIALN
jgi:pantoate--beta-alanine ligase